MSHQLKIEPTRDQQLASLPDSAFREAVMKAVEAGSIKLDMLVPQEVEKREEPPVDGAHRVAVTQFCPVVKRNIEKRLVYGIVLEPDTVDAHGDTITEEVIEETANKFGERLAKGGSKAGIMHTVFGEIGASIVQNYVTTSATEIGDKPVKKGTWIQVWKVHDDALWDDFKTKKLNGFSIGGVATVAS